MTAQDRARANPHFQPQGARGTPQRTTYCNLATCFVVRQTGAPIEPLLSPSGQPALANTDNRNLPNSSDYTRVSPQQAQDLANQGVTVIAVQGSEGPHGHIATVRPTDTYFASYENPGSGSGPMINNIGGRVGVMSESSSFSHNQPVTYYAPKDQVKK